MADDGYKHITNTDYSPIAIQRLQQLYPTYNDRLSYAAADARSMPQYDDQIFHGVLDKGALDALLCGETDEKDAAAVLGEVWRLLAPGAAYVMITSGECSLLHPVIRLQMLVLCRNIRMQYSMVFWIKGGWMLLYLGIPKREMLLRSWVKCGGCWHQGEQLMS